MCDRGVPGPAGLSIPARIWSRQDAKRQNHLFDARRVHYFSRGGRSSVRVWCKPRNLDRGNPQGKYSPFGCDTGWSKIIAEFDR